MFKNLVLLLTIVFFSIPASAAYADNHILQDNTILAESSLSSSCQAIDSGTLVIRLQMVDVAGLSPFASRSVHFNFFSYNGDSSHDIDTTLSRSVSTFTIPVTRDMYCWSVEAENDASLEDSNYDSLLKSRAWVSIRMILEN